MTKSTTNVSDGIVDMYKIAAVILMAPDGSLSDWEENLLINFVAEYWKDKNASDYPDHYPNSVHEDPLND